MIKSSDILYSKTPSDEMYTPTYAVRPLLKYIRPNSTIWCPADTYDSSYVKIFQKASHKVIFSHISYGQSLYEYVPDEAYDFIITNPPFSNKRKVFERLLMFNKPIALLMSNTWLNDKYSKFVFYETNRQMQLLMFDKRIEYLNSEGRPTGKITFSSSYYCSDFLPKDIIIEELNKS